MKVALVHDWLTGTRGGEKVLLELVAALSRTRTLFTLFHFPGSRPPEIEARRDPDDVPPAPRLAPRATTGSSSPSSSPPPRRWDLSGFDLVISSSHCVAKNAKKGAGRRSTSATATRPSGTCTTSSTTTSGGGPAAVRAAARLARAPLARGTSRPCPASTPSSRTRRTSEGTDRAALRARGRGRLPAGRTRGSTRRGPRRGAARASSSSRPSPRTSGSTTPSRPRTPAGFPSRSRASGPSARRLARVAGETVRFAGTPNGRDAARALPLRRGRPDAGRGGLRHRARSRRRPAGRRSSRSGGAARPRRSWTARRASSTPSPAPEGLLAAIDRLRGLRLDSAAPPSGTPPAFPAERLPGRASEPPSTPRSRAREADGRCRDGR